MQVTFGRFIQVQQTGLTFPAVNGLFWLAGGKGALTAMHRPNCTAIIIIIIIIMNIYAHTSP